MYKISITIPPNSIEVESDTGSVVDVLPVIELWFEAIKGTNAEEKGKIEFKINPAVEQ